MTWARRCSLVSKGHECAYARAYVEHRMAEYVCSVCGDIKVMAAAREQNQIWRDDRKRARGKGSKYDFS